MAQNPQDLAALVKLFLPIRAEAVSALGADDLDEGHAIEALAASIASFMVAATHVLAPADRHARLDFSRRVAARSEGAVQAWMVEAALRSAEGDQDAMIGIDPVTGGGIHIYGLVVLNEQYLTTAQAEALRGDAAERAGELLPRLLAAASHHGHGPKTTTRWTDSPTTSAPPRPA